LLRIGLARRWRVVCAVVDVEAIDMSSLPMCRIDSGVIANSTVHCESYS
jgi:hypothetical protein